MTKRARKKLRRVRPWDGEAESAVDPVTATAAKEESWLGPYPVMKALPTFENLTFRKLRGAVQVDQPPMVWTNSALEPGICVWLLLISDANFHSRIDSKGAW